MQFEHIFTTKIDLPTPPQTPLCEENIFTHDNNDESSFNTDIAAADLEVFSLNFTLQDLINEISEETKTQEVVREDIMWGIEINRIRTDTSTPSLVKSLRERSLVTPLNFEFSNLSENKNKNEENEESKKLLDVSGSTWISTDCLLTPAETESDGEIDVVGGAESKCNTIRTTDPNPMETESTVSDMTPPVTIKIVKPETETSTILFGKSLITFEKDVDTVPDNSVIVKKTKKITSEKKLIRGKNRRKSITECFKFDSSDELSSDSSPFPTHRRGAHNNLERKRRDELKRKFENLRDSIPDVGTNERIPKVVILKKASEWINSLHMEEGRLIAKKQFALTINTTLAQKLNALYEQHTYNSVPKFYYS